MMLSRAVARLRRLWGLDDRGSVAVEYALTVPYLLAFMYGIVEISHFAFLRTIVANTAHDAVRYAVVHSAASAQPMTVSDITSYASNELSSLGLLPAGAGGTVVTVTYNPDNNPGSTVNVQISYPFTPFMPGFTGVPGTGISFSGLAGPILGSGQMVISP